MLVHLQQCPNPPPKHELVKLLKEGLTAKIHNNQIADNLADSVLNLIDFMEKNKLPDAKWLLLVISCILPDAYIFTKNYKYKRVN